MQGGLAGSLPIYLFAHAVIALGGGRAATFPALVPVFGVIIGFLALGVVPSLAQFVGMLIVLLGFQFGAAALNASRIQRLSAESLEEHPASLRDEILSLRARDMKPAMQNLVVMPCNADTNSAARTRASSGSMSAIGEWTGRRSPWSSAIAASRPGNAPFHVDARTGHQGRTDSDCRVRTNKNPTPAATSVCSPAGFPVDLLSDASLHTPPALLGNAAPPMTIYRGNADRQRDVHSGISRQLAQAERLDAIRLESRDRSLNQSLRQIPVAESLARFLPFRGHLCPHRAPYTLARYEARA